MDLNSSYKKSNLMKFHRLVFTKLFMLPVCLLRCMYQRKGKDMNIINRGQTRSPIRMIKAYVDKFTFNLPHIVCI